MQKLLLFLIAPFMLQAQNFWTEVAPFTNSSNNHPRQISIVSPSVIWVLGQPNEFSQPTSSSLTLDGGLTWQDAAIALPTDTGASSLHAVSSTTAYLSTFAMSDAGVAGVWKTVDSGATWTQTGTSNFTTPLFFNFLHFFDADHGLAVSDPSSGGFQIFRTANAGATWTAVPAIDVPAPLDNEFGYTQIYRTKNNTVWFGTNKGRIFSSVDAGATWHVEQSPSTDFGGASVSATFDFRNTGEGLMVTRDFGFYRTTDGGANWTQEYPSTVYRNFETIYVTGTNNTYFSIGQNQATEQRGSSYSTDGGQTWIDLNDVDEDPVTPITAKFASGTVGFCIGTLESDPATQRFFRLTDPLNRLLKADSFETVSFEAAPNPTLGMLKIKSSQPIASVILTDVTGKTVMTQAIGSPEATLELSALQAGIYLARVTTDAKSVETLKIVKQ